MKQLGTLYAILRVSEEYKEQVSNERYTCSLTLREYNKYYHKHMLTLNAKKDDKKLHEASLTVLSTPVFSTTSNIFVPCHNLAVV